MSTGVLVKVIVLGYCSMGYWGKHCGQMGGGEQIWFKGLHLSRGNSLATQLKFQSVCLLCSGEVRL